MGRGSLHISLQFTITRSDRCVPTCVTSASKEHIKDYERVVDRIYTIQHATGDARYQPDGLPALPCCCNTGLVSRRHGFWDYPVATAVHQALCAAVTEGFSFRLCYHLWLLQPPAGWWAGVWQVVGLAAIDAMHLSRQRLVGLCLRARDAVAAGPAAAVPARHLDWWMRMRMMPRLRRWPWPRRAFPPSWKAPHQRLLAWRFATDRFLYLVKDFVRLNAICCPLPPLPLTNPSPLSLSKHGPSACISGRLCACHLGGGRCMELHVGPAWVGLVLVVCGLMRLCGE